MYQKSNKLEVNTISSKMIDTVNYLNDYFGSMDIKNNSRMCIMDYDIPIKTGKSKIMDLISQAECMGIVKLVLHKFDPFLCCIKCKDVIRYMHLDYRQSNPKQAILDYGKCIQAGQLNQQSLLTYATGDLDQASCYLLARYHFIHCTIEGFLESCSASGTSPNSFYNNVVKTYHIVNYASIGILLGIIPACPKSILKSM